MQCAFDVPLADWCKPLVFSIKANKIRTNEFEWFIAFVEIELLSTSCHLSRRSATTWSPTEAIDPFLVRAAPVRPHPLGLIRLASTTGPIRLTWFNLLPPITGRPIPFGRSIRSAVAQSRFLDNLVNAVRFCHEANVCRSVIHTCIRRSSSSISRVGWLRSVLDCWSPPPVGRKSHAIGAVEHSESCSRSWSCSFGVEDGASVALPLKANGISDAETAERYLEGLTVIAR